MHGEICMASENDADTLMSLFRWLSRDHELRRTTRVSLNARNDAAEMGAADIIIDYYHGNQTGLADIAGQLGAAYAIPIIYVPLLMITHVAAFYLMVQRAGLRPSAAPLQTHAR